MRNQFKGEKLVSTQRMSTALNPKLMMQDMNALAPSRSSAATFRRCRPAFAGASGGVIAGGIGIAGGRGVSRRRPSLGIMASLGNIGGDSEMISQNSYDEWARKEKIKGLEYYSELKKKMLKDTALSGVLIAVYFAANGVAFMDVFTAAAGGVASYLYMMALMRDIDNIKSTDPTPLLDLKNEKSTSKTILKVLIGYTYALKPRLLVPISLALGLAVANDQWVTIPLSARGTAVGAFLAYQVALFGQVFSALIPEAPKERVPEEVTNEMLGIPKEQQGGIRQDDE